MRPVIAPIETRHTPESLVEQIHREPGAILLRSAFPGLRQSGFSLVAAKPMLLFRSYGAQCRITSQTGHTRQFGNPWHVLDTLMSRYELPDEIDLPFRGLVRFRDSESDVELLTDPGRLLDEYRGRIQGFIDSYSNGALEIGVDHVLLRTSDPLHLALAGYLAGRKKSQAGHRLSLVARQG